MIKIFDRENYFEVWLSLVERLLWEQDVASSNLVTSTTLQALQHSVFRICRAFLIIS
jgi:hypothetical protein